MSVEDSHKPVRQIAEPKEQGAAPAPLVTARALPNGRQLSTKLGIYGTAKYPVQAGFLRLGVVDRNIITRATLDLL